MLSFIHLHFVVHYLIFYYECALSSASPRSTAFICNPCFIIVYHERENSQNDVSFSLCKSIRGKIREISRQSLLSLLCASEAANKTKLSSICFC